MNLQEFIKTALTDIVAGVAEASEAAGNHGAKVGSMRLYGWTKENKLLTDENERPVATVEFDIALAEANSKDTKGGIGVYLGAVGLGSQGASHGEASTHSRIKFSVPLVLPSAKGQQFIQADTASRRGLTQVLGLKQLVSFSPMQ